ILLVIILVTTFVDLWQDGGEGQTIKHFLTEIMVCLSVLSGLFFLWYDNLFLTKELILKSNELHQSKEESNKWQSENASLIHGLSNAIDQQLENWALSPSEKEVALLILKGLSLKEIAEIRLVSERTVRQQSVNVYQKSNLAGRAELSAFFLEDLLKL
ncbi:MAG: helix-turn-helix transcriptional regulator, partial [Bacteriovorax sp.]|nr:helix-turn-helix transcriptional regulator [Bacteriovorax sp.]